MNKKKKTLSKDLEFLIDNHRDPMAISDVKGNILAINSKLATILGEKKENLIGRSGFDYIDKQLIPTRKEAIKIILETKKPYIFEDFDKNRWWSTEIKPIIDENGKVIKIAIYIKNISGEKKSKVKLKWFSDQALMGICIIQGEKIVYANDTIESITGYSKQDFNKQGINLIKKIVHPNDKDFVIDQLRKKLAGDKNVINRYKFRLISKSGDIIWLELYSKTIVFDNQNADLINLIDVTTENKIEETLKETEEKWNSLVENLPESDRILIIDKYGKILYVNRTYPGRDLDDVIGKKIDDFTSKDLIKHVKHHLKIVFNKGISQKYGSYVNTPEGKKRFFHSIAAPIKKDKKIVAVLLVAIDNTKLKEAEKKARESTNYMKNILNSASEIIFTINTEKKITLWNKSAEIKTGYKQKNIINKTINDIKLFENKSEINNYITDITNGRKVKLKEIMINTNYGYKMMLGVSSTEIRNDLNQVSDILFVCWDITHDIESIGDLRNGRSYVIFDQLVDKSVKIIDEYCNKNKKGIIISRDIDYIIKNLTKKEKLNFFILSSTKEKNYENIQDLNSLKNLIKKQLEVNNESIILIDRIDYFSSIYSFEKLIQILYEINDLIKKTKSILLVRINSVLLDTQQRINIEQEFNKIPKQVIKNIKIDENLYEILKFIKKQNEKNLSVTFQHLGKQFKISKITVKKRVESMINKDLIYIEKKGRSKTLNILEKGKNLIDKNKI